MEPGWRKNYTRYKAYLLNVVSHHRNRKDVRAYLEIILSLVTISIFSIFALKPTLVTIASLVKDIETKEDTLTRLDQKINDIGNANRNYDRDLNRILLLEMALPDDADPIGLTKQVETVSNIHSNAVISYSLGDTVLKGKDKPANYKGAAALPPYTRGITFSINTSSDYENLYNFLSDLENMRRQVRINTLTFNTTETQDGRQLLLLVEGDALYSKETDVVPLSDTTNN